LIHTPTNNCKLILQNYTYNTAIDIGGRAVNQDFISNEIPTRFGKLFILADGMGGAFGGEVASEMAVNTIKQCVLNSQFSNVNQVISEALHKANNAIFQYTEKHEEYRGMGTTAVILILKDDQAYYGYIGDSRLYQIRGQEVVFMTRDHSKVFDMVKNGILTEAEAENHPESNIILKAIGVSSELNLESQDVGILEIQEGDSMVLVSDGVSGILGTHGIVNIVVHDNENVASTLILKSNQLGFDSGGGHDNMSAIYIKCLENRKSLFHSGKIPKSRIKKVLLVSIIFICLAFGLVYFYTIKLNNSGLERFGESHIESLDTFTSYRESRLAWNKLITLSKSDNQFLTYYNKSYLKRIGDLELSTAALIARRDIYLNDTTRLVDLKQVNDSLTVLFKAQSKEYTRIYESYMALQKVKIESQKKGKKNKEGVNIEDSGIDRPDSTPVQNPKKDDSHPPNEKDTKKDHKSVKQIDQSILDKVDTPEEINSK